MMEWFSKVWAVAAFEARLSRRMWRVWILGALALFFPVLILMIYGAALHRRFSGWTGTAGYLTGDFAVLYSGLMLGGFCTLIGIFFVFDWRRRDVAARFEPTYDASAISPNQYALGKFLGLAAPYPVMFFLLACLQALWAWLDDVPISFSTFVVANFWMGLLPSLGLVAMSFGIAGATRSRALAIVLPVVYFGCSIAIALTLPELVLVLIGGLTELPVHSNIVGYSLGPLFWGQRLAQVALMAFFVSLGAAGGYGPKRSAAALAPHWLAVGACAAIYLGSAGFLAWQYTSTASAANAHIEAERAVAGLPVPGVVQRDLAIELLPESGELKGKAELLLVNDGELPFDKLPLRLNAGLEVTSVTAQGQELRFERDAAVLLIEPPAPLAVGAELGLSVTYEGGLDLLSVDARTRLRVRDANPQVRPNLRFLGTLPAYLESGAVAFGMDLAWYPQVGMLLGQEFPARRRRPLAVTTLKVDVPEDWIAVSAGERSGGNGSFTFAMDVPVPGLSLNAGPYQEHEFDVDGITYRIAEHPAGHSNVEFFAEVVDVLKEEIRRQHELIESRTGLTYPYPEFSLVEVPQHMSAYGGDWDAPNRFSAPGVVMFREGGILGARFETALTIAKAKFEKEAGGTKSVRDLVTGEDDEHDEAGDEFDPAAAKLDLLTRFVRTDWLAGDLERLAMRSFWDYRLAVEDESSPILDFALSNYVAEVALGRATVDHPSAVRVLNSPEFAKIQTGMVEGSVNADDVVAGMADVDEVYRKMTTVALDDLEPEGLGGVFLGVMHAKGRQPLSAVRETLGRESFSDLLARLLEDGADVLTWDEFERNVRELATAEERTGLEGLLSHWRSGVELPGFVVTNARKQRLPGDDESWQVLASVANRGTAAGTAKFRAGKGDDARFLLFSLAAGEEVEVGLTTEVEPSSWQLWPYLSMNRSRPAGSLSLVDESASVSEAVTEFKGTRALPETAELRPIIVDNLDEAFTVTLEGGEIVTYEARSSDGDEPRLKPVNEGLLVVIKPSKWTRWRGGRGSTLYTPYGLFDVTAAMKKGTETGEQPARWEVALPEPGTYRVEAYMPPNSGIMKRVLAKQFHFVVKGSEGESDVTLALDASERGWNDLGRFQFEDAGEVLLRDLGDGLIVADAVRFIKEKS